MLNTKFLTRCGAALCAALLHGAPAYAAGSCQYVQLAKLPIHYRGAGLEITVDGRINGKPATMLADTGAYAILLTAPGAEAFQLKRREAFEYAIGVGGRSDMHEAYLDEFSIGGTRPAKGWARVVEDMGEKPPYDAIAGVPFLMQTDLEVALADKELRFFQASGCDDAFLAYWDRNAVKIPYRRQGAPWPVFSIEINGNLMSAIIDTGTTASTITAYAARKFGLATSKPDPKELSYTTGGGTRRVPTWITHTQSIKIGGETILDADIQVIDDRGRSDVDVILGADFLRAHRVLFAISQQNIYLSYLGGDVFMPRATIEPWMRKEAENGNPDAQMRLARHYLHGKGVARDEVQAQVWLDKAAALGHVEANLTDGYRKLKAERYADAASRLQAVLAKTDDGRFEALALYRARVGSGQQALGAEELAARFARFDKAAWPAPIAEYFLGHIDGTRLQALAAADADFARERGCDALDEMTGLHLAQGNAAAAEPFKAAWNKSCATAP
ncbi:retroviral-like aspartic protease family protein [Massilia pinisoli]|uniref:Retroviral-like aspartic protease family protein n=1 Tax=Massilia pinisoli TaxID=1772194 RepID=A0ABT1ZUD3_9BURK|nr:retroviral-like aspartic protease family protein [Massilia pinisoli]MCS0583506.1 retroviral-like aspartic protease family protein [Massilia pinisoli]